jgi:drug/metabolite transporter (DMT)-like permease
MSASSLSFKLAVLFVVAGMAMGMGMAAAHDHSIMPAHAHLNLLGWVSLFLFGIYYRLNPSLERSRLAFVQIVVWAVGTVLLTIAVAAIHLGHEAAEPMAGVASFIVLAAMLLFGYLVFRPAASLSSGPMLKMTPAE